jgi:hypothetical protein
MGKCISTNRLDHNSDLNEYTDDINNTNILQKRNIFSFTWSKIILYIEIAKTDMFVYHTSRYILDL